MGKRSFSLVLKTKKMFSDSGIARLPGMHSIHKYLYKLTDPKGIVLISVQGSKMYVNTQDKAIVPQLLRDGVWEKYETELIHKLIKPGDIVADIGANIGYYTLIAAKLAGDEGKVYSFEPESNNFELLNKNIKINGYTNCIPVKKALSNKKGEIKLFLNSTNLGAHSFIDDRTLNRRGGEVYVQTITLDDYFENEVKSNKIDFIKMDAEGAEGLVISGAHRILKENNVKILMEFWPNGLRKLGTDPLKMLHELGSFGFKIKLLDEKKCQMRGLQNNEIIDYCDIILKGEHEVNLFLEK